MSRNPLLVPLAALMAGVEVALTSATARPLLAVGLLAAALALGSRSGLAVAAAVLGLLTVWVRPAPSLGRLDLRRPVAVEARPLSAWQRSGRGWSAPVRLERVVQGKLVVLERSLLWLGVSGEEKPPAGHRIRARGVIRYGHPPANGVPVRAPPARMWVKSRRLVEVGGSPSSWSTAVGRLWDQALEPRSGASDGVALARALVLGERGGLGRRFEQGLRRAGLGHLLALSGLHVGILAAAGLLAGRLLAGALRACGVSGRLWSWLPALVCASAYLWVVGPRPAIVRASLMAMLGYAMLARGGPTVRWNTLALVLAGMLLWSPRLLHNLSFQLTSAATAGILFASRPGGFGAPGGGKVAAAVRVSVAAQAFTLPWALPVFHLLAPAAPLHNLWAVPWTAFVVLVALGWTLLAWAWPRAATWSAGVLDLGSLPFEFIGRTRAGFWWSLPLSLSPLQATGVALAAAAALRRPWLAAALLSGLALLVGSMGGRVLGPSERREWPELSMVDVGQGEALLLRDRGSAVLIDGGGWAGGDLGARILVPALARLGVRALEAVALTHPDLDHCRGLADIAVYLPVRELWTPAGWAPRPCLLDLLSAPGVRWRPMWEGMTRTVGRWQILALHPRAGDRAAGNDRSLVLRVETLGFRALLTGDVERRAELAMLERHRAGVLEADLLKVPHHGSRTSTGAELLEAVRPRLAWIASGRENRYGHPAHEVLERLRARGVRILRTDRDGMVVLRISPSGRVRLIRPGAPAWAAPEGPGGSR